MSLPFVSENIACTLIGVIGDIERFSTYKEFKKYLGVSAENKQSGTSVTGTRQTYSGVRDARRVLYQIALIILANGEKHPTVFKASNSTPQALACVIGSYLTLFFNTV
jgi:transposase